MPRVRLVNATIELLAAALKSSEELAARLEVTIPEGWPEFPEALPHTLDAVKESPSSAAWWMYFFIDDAVGGMVGSGGFAGPPSDGVVEIGYEIAPAFRRRGYATAAVDELVRMAALSDDVRRVVAHTLTGDEKSGGVLLATGFEERDRIRAEGRDVTVWSKAVARAR